MGCKQAKSGRTLFIDIEEYFWIQHHPKKLTEKQALAMNESQLPVLAEYQLCLNVAVDELSLEDTGRFLGKLSKEELSEIRKAEHKFRRESALREMGIEI